MKTLIILILAAALAYVLTRPEREPRIVTVERVATPFPVAAPSATPSPTPDPRAWMQKRTSALDEKAKASGRVNGSARVYPVYVPPTPYPQNVRRY